VWGLRSGRMTRDDWAVTGIWLPCGSSWPVSAGRL